MAVVLVDGWPTDKVAEASRLARESGINIFFITIEGPDENEKKNVIETNFVDKVRGKGTLRKVADFGVCMYYCGKIRGLVTLPHMA